MLEFLSKWIDRECRHGYPWKLLIALLVAFDAALISIIWVIYWLLTRV